MNKINLITNPMKKKELKRRLLELEDKFSNLNIKLLDVCFDSILEPAELSELPEKWAVEVTGSNADTIHEFMVNNCKDYEGFNSNWKIHKFSGYFHYPQPGRLMHSCNIIEPGYTEISFADFKRLALKEKETQKMEVGKWYKRRHNKALFYVIESPIEPDGSYKVYGFDKDGDWMTSKCPQTFTNNDIPATDEEVFEALRNEATRRGFKEGVTHTITNGDEEVKNTHERFGYDKYNNKLLFANYSVFENGKWAEIVTGPEIDWSKPGQLFECTEHEGLVVMLSDNENDNVFAGVCLQNRSTTYTNTEIGDYDQWAKNQFKPYTGSITLSNN